MARLIVNPGSPSAWEIELKPGANTIGRGFANDFKIADPSVSGSHCQITVDSGRVIIKDLGSTNGTFVNRAPVTEASLQAGQTVHLGGVEMVFQGDAAVASSGGTIHITAPAPRLSAAAPAAPMMAAAPAMAPHTPTVTATGAHTCKFHPKTAARYFCNHCQLPFCELCVTSRNVGGASHKFCRRCGNECETLQVQVARPTTAPSFFRRLPGAFAYPAKGAGVFVLVVCTIVIFALDFVSGGSSLRQGISFLVVGSLFARMVFYGYLFSFMQSIIHSTTAGDEEMPGWPSFDDLFGAFLRLAGAAVISFGPYLILFCITLYQGISAAFSSSSGSDAEPWSAPPEIMTATLVLGCLYFPMALLAVAMKDSPLAANPLVVLPAIFKGPLEYLLAVIVLAVVMALRALGDPLIHSVFPRGLTTHNMAKMFGFLAAKGLWNFVAVYLLAVNMRVLGLLYLAKKQKLGWFEH